MCFCFVTAHWISQCTNMHQKKIEKCTTQHIYTQGHVTAKAEKLFPARVSCDQCPPAAPGASVVLGPGLLAQKHDGVASLSESSLGIAPCATCGPPPALVP